MKWNYVNKKRHKSEGEYIFINGYEDERSNYFVSLKFVEILCNSNFINCVLSR